MQSHRVQMIPLFIACHTFSMLDTPFRRTSTRLGTGTASESLRDRLDGRFEGHFGRRLEHLLEATPVVLCAGFEDLSGELAEMELGVEVRTEVFWADWGLCWAWRLGELQDAVLLMV